MTACFSTHRVRATPGCDASDGRVVWTPIQSIWTIAMTCVGVIGGALTFSWDAASLFLVTTAITIGFGHSVGMHRLLIHRGFACPKPIEYVLVYLGCLVGMAGPFGMMRTHDMRDWAQRQDTCHDFWGHRRGFFVDYAWQMHGRLALDRPPAFEIEPEVANDPVYRFLERTWRWQQLPWAILFFAVGGWSWVIWGICLRVAVSLTGHWMVGHFAHRDGHQGWRVEGAAVQGYNLGFLALITFGESWHGNHHAFPGSAKLGIEEGQPDPGWWTILIAERLGLAWDIVEPEHLPHRPMLRRVGPPIGINGRCRFCSTLARLCRG